MAIAGRDRRGLGEIVAIAAITISVSAVLVAQIFKGHEPDKALAGALVGLVLLVTGRGVQSAMERGASSEVRNFEATELKLAVERVDRQAEELRRAAAEMQRAHVETVNRMLLLVAAAPRQGG